jgi:hypothetical protein
VLGDALTDLALMLRDPYFKARITAVSKLALLADRDKRAVVLLQEAMLDSDALVRATAIAAIARAGVIDRKVDPCLRNLVLSTLKDRAQNDPEEFVRTRAKAARDPLMEMNYYTPGLPSQIVCPLPPANGELVPFDAAGWAVRSREVTKANLVTYTYVVLQLATALRSMNEQERQTFIVSYLTAVGNKDLLAEALKVRYQTDEASTVKRPWLAPTVVLGSLALFAVGLFVYEARSQGRR